MEMEGTDSTQGKEAALAELEMPWIQGWGAREGGKGEGGRQREKLTKDPRFPVRVLLVRLRFRASSVTWDEKSPED